MLLPALNKAREVAKKIKCLNNLKTLGLGNINYANDYSGFFVPLALREDGTNAYWINNAVFRNACGLKWKERSGKSIACYYNITKDILCPNATYALGRPVGNDSPTLGNSYGMVIDQNIYDTYPTNSYESYNACTYLITNIKQPSQKFVFCDSRNWRVTYSVSAAFGTQYAVNGESPASDTSWTGIAYRHPSFKATNMLLADGHAVMLRESEITGENNKWHWYLYK
jgi:prepilin-type processing-associated H-X9-DG protein